MLVYMFVVQFVFGLISLRQFFLLRFFHFFETETYQHILVKNLSTQNNNNKIVKYGQYVIVVKIIKSTLSNMYEIQNLRKIVYYFP